MTRSIHLPEVEGGDDPAEDAERYHDDERDGRQLQRVPERGGHEGAHRRLELVGGPEVAPDESRHPAPVLADERPIDAELASNAFTALSAANGPRTARPGSPGRT